MLQRALNFAKLVQHLCRLQLSILSPRRFVIIPPFLTQRLNNVIAATTLVLRIVAL